jgi:hypothetical protein
MVIRIVAVPTAAAPQGKAAAFAPNHAWFLHPSGNRTAPAERHISHFDGFPDGRLETSGNSPTRCRGGSIDDRTLKQRVRDMVRKLYRYLSEHPEEPAPTFDEPPPRLPWREAA